MNAVPGAAKDGYVLLYDEGEKAMLKGMKSQRQLAAFVALAVGGAFAGLPAAYAAQSTRSVRAMSSTDRMVLH